MQRSILYFESSRRDSSTGICADITFPWGNITGRSDRIQSMNKAPMAYFFCAKKGGLAAALMLLGDNGITLPVRDTGR